jgi:hypothetical protein
MPLTSSECTGPSGRQWPLYFLELRPGTTAVLHRQVCDRWKPPTSDVGRFATARTAFAIARLEMKTQVEPCRHCCAKLLPTA